MTIKEAMNTTVFVIVPEAWVTTIRKVGNVTFESEEVKSFGIEETTLYDHIMESEDETTTPRGVAPREFVERIEPEDEVFLWDIGRYEKVDQVWTISSWGVGGNHYSRGTEYFSTEEAAEQKLFERIFEYDFANDDQRDTRYFESREEAEEELAQNHANLWLVSPEVAKTIYRQMKCVEKAREQREKAQRAKIAQEYDRLAEQYAKLIPPVPGETYKETCSRLSKAIGEHIPKRAFHQAVKIIRKKL
jgi:hypothetical protein